MSIYNRPRILPPLPIYDLEDWVSPPDLGGGGGGFQGAQGAIGQRGFQGFQGNQGFQGVAGVAGAGFQGAQGWQGFQGLQGVQGAQGGSAGGDEYLDLVLNGFAGLAPTLTNLGQSSSWSVAGGVANTSFACCSGNGQYIYITCTFNTQIARSTDYGQTFSFIGQAGGAGIVCSTDGRILYITSGTTLFKSTDYGLTFSSMLVIAPDISTVLCSGDGRYVYTINYTAGGNIYRSTDYGATFTIVGTNPTGTPVGGQGCGSATGQYALFPLAPANQIIFTNDYGLTWNVVAIPVGCRSGAISASGQFISICAWTSNQVAVSDDYGATYRAVSIPVSPSGMAMSFTGQYQYVGSLGGSSSAIYLSEDWGQTWSGLPTPNTATDNAFNVYCSGSGQILGYAGGGSTYISASYLQTVPFEGSFTELYTQTYGATTTFDINTNGALQKVVLTGSPTLALTVSNNRPFVLLLEQDGVGSHTVTFFTTIAWAGGTPPTLTTTAGKTDAFGFIRTSSGNYLGYVVGLNA